MNCRIDRARDDGEAGTQMFASKDEAKEAARGDDSQRCTTGLVEPVRGFDDQQDGRALSRFANQLEGRESDQEQLGSDLVEHAERHQQRGALARGQPSNQVKDRSQKLMEAGEGQARLRLNPDRGKHLHPAVLYLLDDRRQ